MHTPTHFNGQPCIDLTLPAGDRVRIALHGAHVVSWTTADGVEHLYLSPKAHIDGHSPIRGGVPICFPQFNQRVLAGHALPKHGFARTQKWLPDTPAESPAHEIRLRLTSNTATRSVWPHDFEASLVVALKADCLRMTFTVANTGVDAFPFALALHTYLRTADIARTRVNGLAGLSWWDAVEHLDQPALRKIQPAGQLVFMGETDSVYEEVATPLTVSFPGAALQVSQSASLPDTVVWNPGPIRGATLDDLPADGYRNMLCVEAARINQPVSLAPGESWSGWQELRVLAAGAD